MTTAAQAFAVIRARLEANSPIPLRWQGEDGGALPDEPTAFAFIDFTASTGFVAGYGGGRGSNLYRNPARIDAYVFVPNGQGSAVALGHAETIAALFRSYRDSDISCFDATVHPGGPGADVKPPGMDSVIDSYWYAVAEIGLYYDLIG